VANWVLFTTESDALAVGPAHHIVIDDHQIFDDESGVVIARRAATAVNSLGVVYGPWTVAGREYDRRVDVCDAPDGDEDPWPEFDKMSLDEVAR
jgi:hypothetical protein